jgi:hypothetical protein
MSLLPEDLTWKGEFNAAPKLAQDVIKELVSHYHFRDGSAQHDGSIGTINITPGELRDLLTMCCRATFEGPVED